MCGRDWGNYLGQGGGEGRVLSSCSSAVRACEGGEGEGLGHN